VRAILQRLWPRSIFGRLLAVSALAILAALAFASIAIGSVLERFVMRGFDDRLDAQVALLARAVQPGGTFDAARAVNLPGFGEAGSEWIWQVDAPDGRQWSSTGTAAALPPPVARPPLHDERRPRPGDGRGARGERQHFRILAVDTAAGAFRISASGPRRIVEGPLREAMVPLLLSLALLGAGLALATIVQLRIGLRPLRTLKESLGQVRAGELRRVPADQPVELAPLAAELNALLDQNAEGLAHARQHVANLAHGLKTPLAALALELAGSGRDPDGNLGKMVEQIDRRVRHHLGRARAASPGGLARGRTLVAPAVADLIDVLRRIHAERAIDASFAIAPDLAVAIDPQDLDEMMGNLLDNAWRHARSRIRVVATANGAEVAIEIADDGPGLDEAAIRLALMPGRRLDERGDGHGFGLSIATELAELNGGSLALGRPPANPGLIARLVLPSS
jgi:signal transduction histidine kinase